MTPLFLGALAVCLGLFLAVQVLSLILLLWTVTRVGEQIKLEREHREQRLGTGTTWA